MVEREPQTWEAIQARLPILLNELRNSRLLTRDEQDRLPEIPERGIYVFYDGGEPQYVGRSNRMRERIQEHGYPSSGHNAATFAFLLAVDAAKEQKIDCTNRTRSVLQEAPEFKPLYDLAKGRVRGMAIRVIEVVDAVEQSVFEIYAALRLPTIRPCGYNDFENH